MAKILILGETGTGKTSSLGPSEQLGIQGLDPKETFIIGCANRSLPFSGWKKMYKFPSKPFPQNPPVDGNYLIAVDSAVVNIPPAIDYVARKRDDINVIVIDDTNYVMQDYYMENALKQGYDVFKKIGNVMRGIFRSIAAAPPDKHIIMMAHPEEYKKDNAGNISFRFKTVGQMVNQYITPEGKFDIVLFTKQEWDDQAKKVKKYFVTEYDGTYPAKTPAGMFNESQIPNDLGLVLEQVRRFEEGE